MSDLKPKVSKYPAALSLTVRGLTMVMLAVSMVVLRSDGVTYKAGPFTESFAYKDVSTYQYVFFAMVAGSGYTLLQFCIAIIFFLVKKRLINNSPFLWFEFYGDKICLTILASAVGSVFGATIETMKGASKIERLEGGYDAIDFRSKIDEFGMLVYISAAFLLVGCLCSMISSIMSSRAYSK